MSLPNLDLTLLTSAEASALASIAEQASIGFLHAEQAAKRIIAQGAEGRWLAERQAELAEATRLRNFALDLRAAAYARERAARREEDRAARAALIEAEAQAVAA